MASAAYTTRELKKWDVYYIEKIDDYGGRVGRPAIIVSPDNHIRASQYTVNGIFLTTSPRNGLWYPQITSTGRKSYAVCCEINTISRQHIGSYCCTLTPAEIDAVEQGLMDYFELTDDKDCLERTRMENESLVQKIAELEKKLADATEVIEAKDLDLKVRELAYDKVIGRLVDKQIELDFLKKLAQAPVVEEPKPEKPVAEEKPVEAPVVEEKVDINRCTERDLMDLGFTFSVARNIAAARPFMKVDDLRIVPGVTRIAYGIVEKKITTGDISEYLPKKENPKPVKLDPMEEPEPVVVEAAGDKVNINTASAAELHEKLGLSLTVCYSITGVRKREGLYKSIEDLKNVPRFTAGHWALYEDKVCI